MHTMDLEVLTHAATWLEGNERVWLCTIVKTVGSSPRPVGSMLAVNQGCEQVGSLSGGCVEDDLIERITSDALCDGTPTLIQYGVSPEENERLGLPCGGRLHVLVQALSRDRDQAWIQQVLKTLLSRQCIRRSLSIEEGHTVTATATSFEALKLDADYLHQSFGPRMRMLLVGAGQLSQTLAELAQAMDYEVVVSDPRAAAREQWDGPAVTLVSGMPDDAVREHANDEHSIIITLTHDPRIDDMALMGALESGAWYIGALGSERTTLKRLERLRQLDFSATQLARLHAPVGLPIGSKTPIEIAVSIMAQITELRRSRQTQAR